MCHTDDVFCGRSPDRHQASRELCGEEVRTNDAHLCDRKSARRNCLKNNGKQTKSSQNSSRIGPWSVLGAFSGSKVTPKLKKHPKRDAKEAQGRRWGAPGAPQERPRVPKESPERAQERSWEASGESKSRKSQSPRRKKSILAKVLRDSALPMRGALWTPSNRSKIKPECSKVGS